MDFFIMLLTTTIMTQANQDACYFCGQKESIEEHHILPQRFDGSDRKSNTVNLCHSCHWKLERLYNKDFWDAIGVEDPRSTKETHLTCEHHGCLNQAVGDFRTTVGIVTYRCKEHKPSNSEESPKLKSVDDADQEFINKTISQLELVCQRQGISLPYRPNMEFSDGREWEKPERGVALVHDSRHTFKLEREDGEWSVSYEGYRKPE
jgi:hypothetical protein